MVDFYVDLTGRVFILNLLSNLRVDCKGRVYWKILRSRLFDRFIGRV